MDKEPISLDYSPPQRRTPLNWLMILLYIVIFVGFFVALFWFCLPEIGFVPNVK